MARALITGVSGQDGSYLAELLLAQGEQVHGLLWPPGPPERTWLAPWVAKAGSRLILHPVDICDGPALVRLIEDAQPDEIYHLAGQSHVGASFEDPERVAEVNGMGTLRLLEAVRRACPGARFLHASSSEIFGQPEASPQNEQTALNPVTPYGCSKAFATQITRVYRRIHGLFALNVILYNHESPRRGESFVSRKVTRAVAAIKLGQQQELTLGDLEAQRDWGDARDYVQGMRLALRAKAPEDFVLATGRLHSVRELVEAAFAAADLDWTRHVRHDSALLRPAEPQRLVGDASKARRMLGWEPRIPFAQTLRDMVQADLERLREAAAAASS